MTPSSLGPSILTAALEGLERKKQQLGGYIAEIRALLGFSPSAAASSAQPEFRPHKKRSAAARRHMAEAQRRRYAALRAQAEQPNKSAGATKAVSEAKGQPKKTMSAAARKRIAAAQRKRWAAVKKQAAAAKKAPAAKKRGRTKKAAATAKKAPEAVAESS